MMSSTSQPPDASAAPISSERAEALTAQGNLPAGVGDPVGAERELREALRLKADRIDGALARATRIMENAPLAAVRGLRLGTRRAREGLSA